MAVKFSQFLAEALSSPSFLVGYNSSTNQNVKVSYADLQSAFGGGGGGIAGSGTTNYVTKWTGSSAVGNSQIFDNGTNVGIGTASPTRKLTILGSSDALMDFNATSGRRYTIGADGSGYLIFDDTAGLYRFYINSNGNVGIGTINPLFRLNVFYSGLGENGIKVEVVGDSTARNFLAQFNDAGRYSVIAYTGSNYSSGEALEIMTFSAYPIKFYTNNTERARFFGTGNFAIGTTTDAGYKLDVNGTARVQSFLDVGPSTAVLKIGEIPLYTGYVGMWYNESSPSLSNFRIYLKSDEISHRSLEHTWYDQNTVEYGRFTSNYQGNGKGFSIAYNGGWSQLFMSNYIFRVGNIYGGSSYDYIIYTPAGNTIFGIDADNNNIQIGATGYPGPTPGARLDINVSNNLIALKTSGGSLTGSNAQAHFDLAQTWNTTGNPTLIKANVTNTASGASSLLMDLQVGGTSQFAVTKAGSVGIGTASPACILHVLKAGTPISGVGDEVFIGQTSGNAVMTIVSSSSSIIRFTNSTTTELGRILYNTITNNLNLLTSNSIVLTTGSTDVLIITNQGRVGIGTSTPGGILHVHKGGTPISGIGDEVFIGQTSGNSVITIVSEDLAILRLTNSSNTELGAIQYSTLSNFMALRTNQAERMRITSGGNVLIGTTTDAGYKLDVNGTARFNGAVTFKTNTWQLSDDGKERIYFETNDRTFFKSYDGYEFRKGNDVVTMILDENGNLYLGSSIPAGTFKLEVRSGDSYLDGQLTIASNKWLKTTDNKERIYFQTNDANYYKSANGHIFRNDSNTDLVAISNGGTLSVNTITPNASAIMQIDSTTQGFAPPRMTNAQMTAIATPLAGLVVYDTTNNKLNVYNGTAWDSLH